MSTLTKLNRIFYFCAYTVVCCALVASGLYFAFLKNEHTLIQRDINQVEQQTRNHKNLLTQYQADLQNSSNRFLLKEKIKSAHTELKPIVTHDVVSIPSVSRPRLVKSE